MKHDAGQAVWFGAIIIMTCTVPQDNCLCSAFSATLLPLVYHGAPWSLRPADDEADCEYCSISCDVQSRQ